MVVEEGWATNHAKDVEEMVGRAQVDGSGGQPQEGQDAGALRATGSICVPQKPKRKEENKQERKGDSHSSAMNMKTERQKQFPNLPRVEPRQVDEGIKVEEVHVVDGTHPPNEQVPTPQPQVQNEEAQAAVDGANRSWGAIVGWHGTRGQKQDKKTEKKGGALTHLDH